MPGDAQVLVVERSGHETLAWVTLGGHRLVARLPAGTALEAGDTADVSVAGEMVHLFAQESGERINGPCRERVTAPARSD